MTRSVSTWQTVFDALCQPLSPNAGPRPACRPALEELESRLAPAVGLAVSLNLVAVVLSVSAGKSAPPDDSPGKYGADNPVGKDHGPPESHGHKDGQQDNTETTATQGDSGPGPNQNHIPVDLLLQFVELPLTPTEGNGDGSGSGNGDGRGKESGDVASSAGYDIGQGPRGTVPPGVPFEDLLFASPSNGPGQDPDMGVGSGAGTSGPLRSSEQSGGLGDSRGQGAWNPAGSRGLSATLNGAGLQPADEDEPIGAPHLQLPNQESQLLLSELPQGHAEVQSTTLPEADLLVVPAVVRGPLAEQVPEAGAAKTDQAAPPDLLDANQMRETLRDLLDHLFQNLTPPPRESIPDTSGEEVEGTGTDNSEGGSAWEAPLALSFMPLLLSARLHGRDEERKRREADGDPCRLARQVKEFGG